MFAMLHDIVHPILRHTLVIKTIVLICFHLYILYIKAVCYNTVADVVVLQRLCLRCYHFQRFVCLCISYPGDVVDRDDIFQMICQ